VDFQIFDLMKTNGDMNVGTPKMQIFHSCGTNFPKSLLSGYLHHKIYIVAKFEVDQCNGMGCGLAQRKMATVLYI
jgi:hypothetical protein